MRTVALVVALALLAGVGTASAAVRVYGCVGFLENRCPASFAELSVFLDSGVLASCFVGDLDLRAAVLAAQQNYWFNDSALCSVRAGIKIYESAFYVVRQECQAGEYEGVRRDLNPTECHACEPGTFSSAPSSKACMRKQAPCSGREYDDAPEGSVTQDVNCVEDKILSTGLVPVGTANARQFEFAEARWVKVHYNDSNPYEKEFLDTQTIQNSQGVLAHVWKHSGFKLPQLVENRITGFKYNVDRTLVRSCNAGYQANPSSNTCDKCDPGTAKHEHGDDAVHVPSSNTSGAQRAGDTWYTHVRCAPCAGGTFAQSAGSSSCEQCPRGSFCPPRTSTPKSCEALDALPRAGERCDPSRDYLTGPCLEGASSRNCRACPRNKTKNENAMFWRAYGWRAHCEWPCEENERLRGDWEQRGADDLCEPCLSSPGPDCAACGDGKMWQGGACVACASMDNEATRVATCGSMGEDAYLNTSCQGGQGLLCTQCESRDGRRAAWDARESTCTYACDSRPLADGSYYVTAERARSISVQAPRGALDALNGTACVHVSQRAFDCSPQVATYNSDEQSIRCEDNTPCDSIFMQVELNTLANPVCVCVAGTYSTGPGPGVCRPCPHGMTSLPGTNDLQGCFCRPGFALSGVSQCIPCGRVPTNADTSHYCPGGFRDYAQDVRPFRQEHLAQKENTSCFGGAPAVRGQCACPNSTSVPAALVYASRVTDCQLSPGQYYDDEGIRRNCEAKNLSEFTGERCARVCVRDAVLVGHDGECACTGNTRATADGAACECMPGFYRLHGTGVCTECPAGSYCTESGRQPVRCPEDKDAPAKSTLETDCRCRPGYYFRSSSRGSESCLECALDTFCQPECRNFTSGGVTLYGQCDCVDFFRCSGGTRPFACTQGFFYSKAETPPQCVKPTPAQPPRLWHNGLQCEPRGECSGVNPTLAGLLKGFSAANFTAKVSKYELYVLADVAWLCGAGDVLVARGGDRALQHAGEAFACAGAGARVNTAHAVPSMLYMPEFKTYALVHELYARERLSGLAHVHGHLAWNQVLMCADAADVGVRSELAACHACHEQGVALVRPAPAARGAGSLRVNGVLVVLGAQTHAVWGLPRGAACVGETRMEEGGMHFAVHCVDTHGNTSVSMQSSARVPAPAAGASIWTSLVVDHWQMRPARMHKRRTVLSLLCLGNATHATHAHLALYNMGTTVTFVKLIRVELETGHGVCRGARPAHAVDRQQQRLFLAGEQALVYVDLRQAGDGAALHVHKAIELPHSTRARAAWLDGVRWGSFSGAPGARVAVVSIVPGRGLQLDTYTDSAAHNRTLARDGEILAAMHADLRRHPVAAVWAPFDGTVLVLKHVVSLNSEQSVSPSGEHDGHDRVFPLDLLVHATLARQFGALNFSADAQVVLRYNATGVLSQARLVHLTPGDGHLAALAYLWVPQTAPATAHVNVLPVAGRVVAAFALPMEPLLVLQVLHFACAQCREHEEWDAAAGCVCMRGAAALCLPCTAPLGCDADRTVHDASAAGCVLAPGARAAAVYERRCAGCGDGGPFYCPTPTTLHKCPAGFPVALSASGRASSADDCQCAPMSALRAGECAPCAGQRVCTPDLAVQLRGSSLECPADTRPVAHGNAVLCQCRHGHRRTGVLAGYEGAHMQHWPTGEYTLTQTNETTGTATAVRANISGGTDITVERCSPAPCPRGAVCGAASANAPLCLHGYKATGSPGTCVQCAVGEICRDGNVVYTCGPMQYPRANASGYERFCPCRAGEVWRPYDGCDACRAGHYCANGTETRCPRNMHSHARATTPRACWCDAGYYMLPNSTCAQCLPGSFCHNSTQACRQGKTSPPGAGREQDCVCADRERVGENCSCAHSKGLFESSLGTCVPCEDPTAEDVAEMDTDTCTACKPGFWKNAPLSRRYVMYAVNRSAQLHNPLAHEFRRAWGQYRRFYADSQRRKCLLCPPGFSCAGGTEPPKSHLTAPGGGSVFAMLPGGADSERLFPCPADKSSTRRSTSAYGFSSCLQHVSMWHAPDMPPAATRTAPGVLHIDPRVHKQELISALLNNDLRDVRRLLHFIDTSDPHAPWSYTRLDSGVYEFVFEIDAIELAASHSTDMRAVQTRLLAGDRAHADVWAVTLLPALWAAVHNRDGSEYGVARVVHAHLVHNRRSAVLAAAAADAVADVLNELHAPAVHFLHSEDRFPALAGAVARVRLGASHYACAGAHSTLAVASYRTDDSSTPSTGPVHAGAPPYTPSTAAGCWPGTAPAAARLGDPSVPVCTACPAHTYLQHAQCRHCTGHHERDVCEIEPDRYLSTCSWQHDNGCPRCEGDACCSVRESPPDALECTDSWRTLPPPPPAFPGAAR